MVNYVFFPAVFILHFFKYLLWNPCLKYAGKVWCALYCSIFSFSIISFPNFIGYFCVQSNPSTTLIVPGSPQPSLWPWQCLLESACGVCFCISEERVSRGVKRKGKDSEAFKTSEGTTCKLKDHFRFSKILNF